MTYICIVELIKTINIMAQTKNELYDGMTPAEIDMIVDLADADGAYSLFEDEGKYEAAEFVAEKYFN